MFHEAGEYLDGFFPLLYTGVLYAPVLWLFHGFMQTKDKINLKYSWFIFNMGLSLYSLFTFVHFAKIYFIIREYPEWNWYDLRNVDMSKFDPTSLMAMYLFPVSKYVELYESFFIVAVAGS